MMRSFRTSSAILCVLLTLLIYSPFAMAGTAEDPQTTASEVRQQIDEALQSIGSYSAEQRDAALEKAKETLEKTDARIDEFEQQIDRNWDTMNQEARSQAKETLKTLKKQRTVIAEWYGGLKHSSANAWEEIKKGFSKSYTDLEDSIAKAREKF